MSGDSVDAIICQIIDFGLREKSIDLKKYLIRKEKEIQRSFPLAYSKIMPLVNASPKKAMRKLNTKADHQRQINNPLLKYEDNSTLDEDIILTPLLENEISMIIKERAMEDKLKEFGIMPTSSIILSGPPGVGKSLAARVISHQLDLPLMTLDLSMVMSSYLGKTGNNIKEIFDFCKQEKCILFLDEIDAIAKRRDDDSDVGELKRLVTVLLQQIDSWSNSSLLIAATNHPEIIDSALWRRFDKTLKFPKPDLTQSSLAIQKFLEPFSINKDLSNTLGLFIKDLSFSDVKRLITNFKRQSIVEDINLEKVLKEWIVNQSSALDKKDKISIAVNLVKLEMTQRDASSLMGISRTTLNKYMK